MQLDLPVSVKGHVKVEDDLGNVLLDDENAVHPQNMARVIGRSLSNEFNFYVYRIAYGNGGTQIDAANQITYKSPNDGQPPDTRTWDSRIYNETYSEIVDEGNVVINPDLGTDPGSAGPNTGTRPGGGSDPSGDPVSIPHVSGPGVRSNELGLTSEVVITSVINPGEPTGQFGRDDQAPIEEGETSFTFDEIGLYTTGAPAIDSAGAQDVDVGNRTSTDDTGLLSDTVYSFNINVNSGGSQEISFTTPSGGGSGTGNEILYGDLCEAINSGDTNWNPAWTGVNPLPLGTSIAITDNTVSFPSISGSQTFGFLRYTSGTSGLGSAIVVTAGTNGLDMFANLNPPTGGVIKVPVDGVDAGVQNDPLNPTTERERLMTHIIFSPILKASNRSITITYTLTISVARTASI